MQAEVFEAFAVKYAQHARRAVENFVGHDPHDTSDMPLNYYVWVLKSATRTFVIDTGFSEAMAAKRKRQIVRPVAEGLKALNIDPAGVKDVIITHMHYDHGGNIGLFPNARFHLQEAEMNFATGRCMCHQFMRHGYEAADVKHMVDCVFDERVQFSDGSAELAPGLEVHLIGGHTGGIQAVRARTRRGWLVLASDASHFYAHLEQGKVFPIVHDVGKLLDGYQTLRGLASSAQHIIPGHDPLVMQRYPNALPSSEDWIARLDADPS